MRGVSRINDEKHILAIKTTDSYLYGVGVVEPVEVLAPSICLITANPWPPYGTSSDESNFPESLVSTNGLLGLGASGTQPMLEPPDHQIRTQLQHY
eukprot:6213757-Amphidinium_carterae.1